MAADRISTVSLTPLSPSLSCWRPRLPLVLKDSSQFSSCAGQSLKRVLERASLWAKMVCSDGVSFLPLVRFPAASPPS